MDFSLADIDHSSAIDKSASYNNVKMAAVITANKYQQHHTQLSQSLDPSSFTQELLTVLTNQHLQYAFPLSSTSYCRG